VAIPRGDPAKHGEARAAEQDALANATEAGAKAT
jgi:hypothetical protein